MKLLERSFWIKLLNWEYWSAKAFYWPMYVYGPLLALRSRHVCFFTAANPGIKAGGIGVESKFDTLAILPEVHRPTTILVNKNDSFDKVLQKIEAANITFPLIAKPEVGFRGMLVKKVKNAKQLKAYLSKYPINFLIQEFIPYPVEVGILYHRSPDEPKGNISSITLKELLHVIGDGRSTVEALVLQSDRALLQWERINDNYSHLLQTIPQQGEYIQLGIVGNHCKGARFINGNHLISQELIDTIDEISKQIPGFYYGRYDIRCASLESLKQAKDFKIIELNGVCSEPTHIYDPQQISYFGALNSILRHWSTVRKISHANHKRGVEYVPFKVLYPQIRNLKKYEKYLQELGS
ncbi:MAG: D-alanine--D-alanine ligase [Bacteroidota bacterium]